MAQSQEYRRSELPEEATALKIQAQAIERELQINADLAKSATATTETVRYNPPTLDDLQQIRGAGDSARAARLAYELLNPTTESGEIPLRFVPAIEQACFR